MFAGMAVKHCKEALSSDASEIDDKRVSVFHVPARASVIGHADLESGVSDRVLVEGL